MKGQAVFALLVLLTAPSAGVVAGSATVVWEVPGDFATIQDAVDSPLVLDGDAVRVGNGSFAGALLDKSLVIVGREASVIDDGPAHPAGLVQGFRLLAGSDGSRFSRLEFAVDLAIINGDGVDGVQVDHNRFDDAIQAVSNWRGSSWRIHHNRITDLRTRCGGGIGILVGDYGGAEVARNLVTSNTIRGELHVSDGDCGGYDGSGIVLYADFRWGRAGSNAIRDNRVMFNQVAMSSDNPELVDIIAFELTDTRDDASAVPFPVLFDNTVVFNDFRRTDDKIELTPEELGDHNLILRNLGIRNAWSWWAGRLSSRRRGLHHGWAFRPGR